MHVRELLPGRYIPTTSRILSRRPSMRPSIAIASALALAALYGARSGPAQILVPAQSAPLKVGELNSRSNYPLMRAASRSQFVIAQSEIGAPATLTQLALRYDGPT